MTAPGNHRRPDPELRPRPERPEFVVEPLRARQEATGSGVAFRVTLSAWAAVLLVAVGLAAVVALSYDAVRRSLETSVAQDSSGASTTEVADTVSVTLLGSAAVGAVLLILAGVGLTLARAKRSVAGAILLPVGLAATGAFVLFWSFMTDTADVLSGALRWGPLVGAGLAVVATIAAGASLRSK